MEKISMAMFCIAIIVLVTIYYKRKVREQAKAEEFLEVNGVKCGTCCNCPFGYCTIIGSTVLESELCDAFSVCSSKVANYIKEEQLIQEKVKYNFRNCVEQEDFE